MSMFRPFYPHAHRGFGSGIHALVFGFTLACQPISPLLLHLAPYKG